MRSLPPGQSVVRMVWSPRPAGKRVERDPEVARIDAKRRQRAARPEHAQRRLEGLLPSERLDGDVDAAPVGQAPDLLDRIGLREVDHVIGAHAARHLHALRHALDRDDRGRAHQPRARRGAQPDRPLREHRHRVADADAAALRAGEAGRHDVGAHQHLLVGETVRHRRKVRHGVGHEHVLGLAAVDGVAEAPAAQRLPAVLRCRRRPANGSRTGRPRCARSGVIAPAMTRWPSR